MSEHMRKVQQQVDYIMEESLDRAYTQIADQISDEDYTRVDAWKALGNWDLDDHFIEWWAQGEEDE